MKNLAGVKTEDADAEIERELQNCGIEIVKATEPARREVRATLSGALGVFRFERAWYYWVVSGGVVPRAVAEEMYSDPIGRDAVRVEGHCGRPAPEDDVESYHIDTEAGLALFASTMRRHGLVRASVRISE